MNFLSIDCSTDIGSLFIKTKGKTFSKILQSDKLNNDLLMKQIIVFFEDNNLNFEDISNIFVNQGPGNFSGLRGSLAIVKGISLAKNLNLFGYDSFIWMSAKFYEKKDYIFSLIKFRDRYFLKKFDSQLKSLTKIEEVGLNEIVKRIGDNFCVISRKTMEHFDAKVLKLNNLSVVDLDHNALEFLHLRGLLDKKLIKPLYLG
tara:strand:- start:10 stop:615 length:606 start_codon:yes stop_codon:yes gene_type:complete